MIRDLMQDYAFKYGRAIGRLDMINLVADMITDEGVKARIKKLSDISSLENENINSQSKD